MSTPHTPFKLTLEQPHARQGVDDTVWIGAVRARVAAMLVVAHHADVRVQSASLRDVPPKLRIFLWADNPMPAWILARMVAAAAHAQLQYLIEHGADQRTLDRVADKARDELAHLSVRYPVSEEDARAEAAAVLAENTELLGRVTQHVRVGETVTGLHLAALVDPARCDPSPGAPIMVEVNADWLGAGDEITVIAARPTREGDLADLAESLLPTLVSHSHVVTAVPVHELHWPIVWSRNLPGETVEVLADALKRKVWTTGHTLSVEGSLRMIPIGNPEEIGLYLDEFAEGLDTLQRFVQESADEVLGGLRRPVGGHTAIAHFSLARCHTADIVEELVDALGSPTTTVEIASLAVIRMRFDARASCTWWETIAEVTL
ncbi:hypothetical protein [Nocardiopsis nanhaiensis]